jgi:hypothetical protein
MTSNSFILQLFSNFLGFDLCEPRSISPHSRGKGISPREWSYLGLRAPLTLTSCAHDLCFA